MTINEQKKYLSENLIVEDLRLQESNKEDIKHFVQATKGSRLAEYLCDDAWEEDLNRNTKVFLIRDKNSRQIAFYFALNCGILYKEYSTLSLSPKEKAIVDKLIKAIRLSKKKDLSDKEKEYADNLYSEAYQEVYDNIEVNRASNLITFAEEQSLKKEELEEIAKRTNVGEHTKQVQDTFPAIDIKFLCRNKNYHIPIPLDFKMGVYVFWEIIVPHILKIADLIGCKYVYLFAADNSQVEKETTLPPMWTQDYDPYEDDETENNTEIKKLVNYYINEFKFRPVMEYMILKPSFERECYTLVQEVSSLSEKRAMIWSGHEEDNELEAFQ